LDVNLINSFVSAARGVFDTMVRLPLMSGKPHVRPSAQAVNRSFKVSVLIHFHGSADGIAVLHMSEPVALAMANALSGQAHLRINSDVRDALREVANLIIGSAKQHLGADLHISVPKVYDASDVHFLPGCPVVVIPFDTTAGRFVLEVGLQARAAAQAVRAA
jgi:chemotaxis protein CheX